MSLLTSLKTINDNSNSKMYLKTLEFEEHYIRRNISVRVHTGILVDNELDLSTSNSEVFSTSFGEFLAENQFVQVARLCLYGRPGDIPGINVVAPTSDSSTTPAAPTPIPPQRRTRRTASSTQTAEGFLRKLIGDNNIDVGDIGGLISFAKQYMSEQGFTVGNMTDEIRHRIIDKLNEVKQNYCAPF